MAKKKKSILDKIADILSDSEKILRSRKVASGALVAALLGGILKLTVVTQTFPPPSDIIGNVIIFVAILLIAIDICRGGLYD